MPQVIDLTPDKDAHQHPKPSFRRVQGPRSTSRVVLGCDTGPATLAEPRPARMGVPGAVQRPAAPPRAQPPL